MRIREIPASDRPREKLATRGAASLTDAELLAIFLRTGIKGKSAIMLASELLRAKGSLRALSRCQATELSKTATGMGPAKAAELAAAFELGKRLARGAAERPSSIVRRPSTPFSAPNSRLAIASRSRSSCLTPNCACFAWTMSRLVR